MEKKIVLSKKIYSIEVSPKMKFFLIQDLELSYLE